MPVCVIIISYIPKVDVYHLVRQVGQLGVPDAFYYYSKRGEAARQWVPLC